MTLNAIVPKIDAILSKLESAEMAKFKTQEMNFSKYQVCMQVFCESSVMLQEAESSA